MLRRVALPVALVLVAAACSAPTPEIEPTGASPTPTAASPTPTATKARAQARFAVYSSGTDIVVYDVKEDRARSVATAGSLVQPSFLTRTLIAFVQESLETSLGILLTLDLRTGEQREVFRVDDGIQAYGFNPDRTAVAYLTRDDRGFPRLRIRSLVGQETTRSVATLARALGREFTPDDQVKIEWERRGRRFVVVYTPADGDGDTPDQQSQLQVRDARGELLFAADHDTDPTMAVWSPNGNRLYFRSSRGALVWQANDGALGAVVGGERWFDPWPSPSGRRLAYDTGQFDPGARIRVLDLRNGGVTQVGMRGRFHPVFASERFIWAQELEECTGECLFPTSPGNRVFRINRRNGREKRLAITKLVGVDVWYE